MTMRTYEQANRARAMKWRIRNTKKFFKDNKEHILGFLAGFVMMTVLYGLYLTLWVWTI